MAVVMFSVASAQDNNQRQGNRPDPSQMAQRMTEMMASRYGLDDNQKTNLLKLNTDYAGKLPMMGRPRQRPSQEEMDKRFKEMKANQDAYNAEVKKIMTDAQYKQFTENQQRHGRPGKQNENK